MIWKKGFIIDLRNCWNRSNIFWKTVLFTPGGDPGITIQQHCWHLGRKQTMKVSTKTNPKTTWNHLQWQNGTWRTKWNIPSNLSDEDWFTEEVGSLCYQRSWKKKNAMAARKDLMLWPNNKVSQIGENVCELQPNQPVCINIQCLLVMALLLNLLFYLCSALFREENGGK